MAIYTVNRVVKTLTIHKDYCRVIPKEGLRACGCGDRGREGNQRWYCERHITSTAVNAYMKGKFWAIVMCDICFRDK